MIYYLYVALVCNSVHTFSTSYSMAAVLSRSIHVIRYASGTILIRTVVYIYIAWPAQLLLWSKWILQGKRIKSFLPTLLDTTNFVFITTYTLSRTHRLVVLFIYAHLSCKWPARTSYMLHMSLLDIRNNCRKWAQSIHLTRFLQGDGCKSQCPTHTLKTHWITYIKTHNNDCVATFTSTRSIW